MATTTSSISGAQGPAESTSTQATAKNTLGKNDFLRLLTAQLANQDPLHPVDNQAFIAQLAQFSSLEQMQNVASKLDTLLVAAASQTQLGTTSLVGRSVSYRAEDVQVESAGVAPYAQVKLEAPGTVTALVKDAGGRTVRALALGAREAGSFDLGWDGRDAGGNAVPAGSYTLALSARSADGTAVAVEARVKGTVKSVSFEEGAAELVVGGDRVKMSDVVEIAQP